MTGWGGGNPNAAENGPEDGYEKPRRTCPKCGDTFGNLPPHMRACSGDDREGQS